MNTLIFTRHTIRGVNNLPYEWNDVPLFSIGMNASPFGLDLAKKLGKFIRDKFGILDFCTGDHSLERTVNTMISVSRGNEINFCNIVDDTSIFHPISNIILGKAKTLISTNITELEKYRHIAELATGNKLKKYTEIRTGGNVNKVSGYLQQLEDICTIGEFSNIYMLKNPYTKFINKYVSFNPKILKFETEYPLHIAKYMGYNIYQYLIQIIYKYKLSYVCGHDDNLYVLSKYLNINIDMAPLSGIIIQYNNDILKLSLIKYNININDFQIYLYQIPKIICSSKTICPTNIYISSKKLYI